MRIFLYPLTYENQFMLLSSNHEYNVTGAFMLENWKCNSLMVDTECIKIYRSLEVKDYLEECEGILYYPNKDMMESSLKEIILNNIKVSLQAGRQVYCVLPLDFIQRKYFLDIAKQNHVNFYYLYRKDKKIRQNHNTTLYVSKAPIIYIGELCNDLGAKELSIKIMQEMKERGYKVVGILDDTCADFFDMRETPKFLRENILEEEKVLKFNEYIQMLEKQEAPDLFVIQVPESIFPISTRIYNEFGIYCWYYSQAFCPDMFFCVVPSNMCQTEIIKSINDNMIKQYGYGIDGVLGSRLSLDMFEAFKGGVVELSYIEDDAMASSIDASNICVIDSIRENVGDCFSKIIENILLNETIEIL